jgi:hypothetical protein
MCRNAFREMSNEDAYQIRWKKGCMRSGVGFLEASTPAEPERHSAILLIASAQPRLPNLADIR